PHPGQDQLGDAVPLLDERLAEVALDGIPQPAHVLLRDRTVQASLGAHLGEHLGVADLARRDRDGIARPEPRERERDERDHQQNERQPREATDDVRAHTPSVALLPLHLAGRAPSSTDRPGYTAAAGPPSAVRTTR